MPETAPNKFEDDSDALPSRALETAPNRFEDDSDALLSRALGPDLQTATIRMVLYFIGIAVIATIVVSSVF
jgi:hypothetical protein